MNESANEIYDPLLQCLAILTEYYERPYSLQALRVGLPLNTGEKLTPHLLVQAAERVGFAARVVKRRLNQISQLVLPAILLLKDNSACIAYQMHSDNTIELGFPESGGGKTRKSITELADVYSGYAIFIQPVYQHSETTRERHATPQKSWFWGTLWEHRRSYFNVILGSFLINLFALASPLFIMNVYDRVVPNNALVTLWVLAIGIAIIYLFDIVLRMVRHYVIDIVGKKADIRMSSYLFQKVLELQLINKPSSVGGFVSQMRDFEVVRDFFTSATLTTLVDLPFIILYLIFIAYLGGMIVLIPLILLPIIIVTALLVDIPLKRTVQQLIQHTTQKNAVLVETLTGLETIKGMVAENIMQRKWEQMVGSTARLALKSRFFTAIVTNLNVFFQQLATPTAVIIGVYLIEAGKLSLGGLIACTILIGRTMGPCSQVANLITRYQQAKIALQNLNKIIALPEERPINKHFIQKTTFKGDIEFQNVSFQYPGQKIKALDHVSFKIAAGERVGILGQTGSGKTTIQKLLLGFYAPLEGAIYVDGVDISQLDPVDLRRHIGYVPQDHILFSGTIRENIMMGAFWATDEALLIAAQFSGVDQMVSRHPAGFDWPLGERGEGLSGGQRQTVVIARAMLGNPPIFLMDEPTSMTDAKTEEELLARLINFLPHKTLLLVTHRTSPLRLVNRVMVIHQGKLVLDGPRDAVLQKLQQLQTPPKNQPPQSDPSEKKS